MCEWRFHSCEWRCFEIVQEFYSALTMIVIFKETRSLIKSISATLSSSQIFLDENEIGKGTAETTVFLARKVRADNFFILCGLLLCVLDMKIISPVCHTFHVDVSLTTKKHATFHANLNKNIVPLYWKIIRTLKVD